MRLMFAFGGGFGRFVEAAKANNPGERWITVHPNGKDEPGHPVLVKVDPSNPNVGRIIGGAGGKMNYIQVHLKSPEQYKREASIKRAEKQQRAKEVMAGEAESSKKSKTLKGLKEKRDEEERKRLGAIAERLGWGDADKVTMPEAGDLRGLDEKTKDKVKKEHLRKLAKDVQAAVQAAKDLLVTDREARAQAIGEVPLRSDESRLGAETLLDDKELIKAKGYKPESSGVEQADLRADKVRALEGRMKDDAEHGHPEDAARTAGRLARYRAIDEHEIDGANPTILTGWARVVSQRYDRLTNYINAAQDVAKKKGQEGPADPIGEDDRAELDHLCKLVDGPLDQALGNAHSTFGKKNFATWLKLAHKHGLLDPAAAKAIDKKRDALRFEEADAPTPEEITPESLQKLDDAALNVLMEEAAARIRQDVTATPEVRMEAVAAQQAAAASRAATGQTGPTTGDRQQEMVTNPGPRQDLQEEAIVAPLMSAEAKRDYIARAIEHRVIGSDAKPKATAEERDEKREARDTAVTDGRQAAELLAMHEQVRAVRQDYKKKKKAIEKGQAVEGEEYNPENDVGPYARAARGGIVDLHIDPKATADLVQSLEDEIRTRTARSFLDELHGAYREVSEQDHLKAEDAQADLHRHASFGAADALNNHAQTLMGGPVLDRQAIDTLGADGASQVLAWAIHQNRGQDADAIHGALGDYHAGVQKDHAEDAMARAKESFEAANEIHQGMLAQEHGDLTEWTRMNRQRIAHLHDARETLGRTLGALEATASLHRAMGKPPAASVRVSMGPAQTETVANQLRAIGLDPDDYQIHDDGTNKWAEVKASGFPKLVRKIDPEDVRQHADMEAIKRGDHDQVGYLPPNFAKRSQAPAYDGPAAPSHAEPFDYAGQKHPDMKTALQAYIGQRVNDGWSPAQIHADLLRDDHRVAFEKAAAAGGGAGSGEHPGMAEWKRDNPEPERTAHSLFGGDEETEGWRQWKRAHDEHAAQLGPAPAGAGGKSRHPDFHAALDELLPGRHEATGTKQMAEQWGPLMRAMAEEHIARDRGGNTTGALHHQQLHPDHARDAAFRALARHPEAVAAFKPYQETTAAEREALRLAFHRYHARKDTETGPAPADERMEQWAAENPEPNPEQGDLFDPDAGRKAHEKWSKDRDAARARFDDEARAGGQGEEVIDWQGYVKAHRGADRAYQAMQDLVKGRFLQDFHGQYQGLAGAPLKAGIAPIEGWREHRHAMDPEFREWWKSERSKVQGQVQERGRGGRYAEDQVREKINKRMEDEGAVAQRQTTAFGASQEKSKAPAEFDGEGRARPGSGGAPAPHERLTLGDSVEAQIGDLVKAHADMVDPRKPFAARFDVHMDSRPGDDKIRQQRAIKAWTRAKRIGMFLGAGSGKTNVSFGAFGEARARGQARRGLYAVPSIVQNQFGGEALAYLKPGEMKWWANGGAGREERMRAYQDPNTHMVVTTHQSLRDDVTHMLARHLQMPEAEVAAKMTGYNADGTEHPGAWGEQQTDDNVRAALQAHGADGLLDFMAVDEGHTALNRAGKQDSHMARVIDSLGRLSKHVGYMTGSPVKNDPSEIHDQLKKVAPSRYGDGPGKVSRAEFLRRYGADTTASAEALRRELGRHTFLGRIDPGTDPTFHHETLAPSEKQRGRLDEIERAYLDARRARQKGDVDLDAVRRLSPGAFRDLPEDQHYETAKRLADTLGIIRDAAINHAINIHPEGAKLDRIAELVKQRKGETGPDGKPKAGVVFARNLDAVEAIRARLEKDGHKVVTLTGADGADKKAQAKEHFQGGHADVIVLSDAGATGANLQRGSYLIQHDIPQTYMTWDQRQARINRLDPSQKGGPPRKLDIHTLGLDHEWEHKNRERLERKRALHDMLFDGAGERLDDSGLGHYLRQRLRPEMNDETKLAEPEPAPRAAGGGNDQGSLF